MTDPNQPSYRIPAIERHLIASLLRGDPSTHARVAVFVSAADIEDAACRAALQGIEALESPEWASLAEWLRVHRQGVVSEWSLWLVETAELQTTPAYAVHFARTVARASLVRRFLAHLDRLKAEFEEISPVQETEHDAAIDREFAELAKLLLEGRQHGLFADVRDEAAKITTGETAISDLRTGLVDLDCKILGLHRGEMSVVAAQTSKGKSTLALQMALNVALAGGKVVIYSLEMAPDSVARRMLANLTGLDLFNLRRDLHVGEMDAIDAARAELSRCSLRIARSYGATPVAVMAAAQSAKSTVGLDLLVVDYIQLMEDPASAKKGRAAEVGAISRSLKRLALDLGCHVIAVSQLNRASYAESEPRLCHLRDSGAIEQDANVILLLHCDDDRPGDMACHVAKNTHGELGRVAFSWHRPTYRVSDYTPLNFLADSQ